MGSVTGVVDGRMTGFVGRHVAPEMLLLLLLEVGLTFLLAYALLAPGNGAAAHAGTLNHALVIATTVGFTGFLLGLYRAQLFLRARSLLLNTALGGILAFPAAWAASTLLGMSSDWLVGPDRLWPTKILITWIAALFGVRLAFLAAVRSKLFVRRIAVVGPRGDVAGTISAIRAGRAGFLEVARPIGAALTPAELRAAGVRMALTSAARHAAMPPAEIDAFALAGVSLSDEPAFWERQLRRIDVRHLSPGWFAELEANPASRLQSAIARAGDIATSLAFLAFTMPLMLLVALAVRLDSPGPVLYRQERVGLGGRSFVLLKFRSMARDAESQGPAWAQRGDPRVTRLGRLMRRTRIDELPQLINVLRGEMSFIGPRPERPHFVEQLAVLIPHYRERARVKPGLTGWAQVNYPYGASVEDARAKLSYDLFYVRNRSVLLDVLILFATVRVILFQEGAR